MAAPLNDLSAADAVRWLDYEARRCVNGTRDDRELVVLNLPALLKVLALPPMDEFQAAAFRERFKQELKR